MDFINVLGIISGIIGIFGFFYPKQWEKKWQIKAVLVIIIAWLSILIVVQNSKINRVENISKSALLLVQKRDVEFTSEGFILAALSFLEQNKKEFPDTYDRAKMIFEQYNINENRSVKSVGTSYEMSGLLRGIAVLSTDKE